MLEPSVFGSVRRVVFCYSSDGPVLMLTKRGDCGVTKQHVLLSGGVP